ncbi:ATP-binding protein [Dyadobacter chenwenxiniae]|uniref:histidine kinase n=1 Tax=Dyadobacter chenwenxiniae TaxID=2906456 RepID=A0A9X1TGJ4_9BACT|nr:histidine kinase dimerization/phosphoacceptor domain -containing protein [Dyadobacter chenwenxiniae]MCF0065621.1 ATP-binding protein [Dyadobacter chenwenxiniae]UON85531.1 ATP-binding protein [Dyadobacter chenwenxiniae]
MWAEQTKLFAQLRNSKADTRRVDILLKLGRYYMLREYYVYRTGDPKSQLDSALYFSDKALSLSKTLKYEQGTNEAVILKADAFIRSQDMGSALRILSSLQNETRFRLLVILGRHYLFHIPRTLRAKSHLDSSLLFLNQANKISSVLLSDKLQPERIHVKAMQSFILEGIHPSIKIYLELISKINAPGNEDREALLWHELTTLIPLREKKGLTRLYCFQKMRDLYKRNHNQEREAWVLKSIADIHIVSGMLDMAESELLEVLALYDAIGYRELHHIYDLLAITYRSKGDYGKSIFYATKAIESVEATNDSSSALTFYGQLAAMYRELGQSNKSIEWYSKLLDNRSFTAGENLFKFREAGFFARELIKLKREKEALAYMLSIESKNKPVGMQAEASLISSLAFCYKATRHERQADNYYTRLIKLAKKLPKDNQVTANAYYEIGQYFISKHQYEMASSYLRKALHESPGSVSISLKKDIYLLQYKADSGLNNWSSAARNLLIHKQLNDSIFNETKNWQMAELQVQFETAKKQKDIELLNSQNKFQRIKVEEANRTKNILLAAGTLLLVIIGLLLNRYLTKQKSNRILEEKKKELDEKNKFLETLNAEQDKLLEEKQWLIKEVHHRVKNNLQMVTSLLNSQSVYLEDDKAIVAVKDSLRRIQAMSLIHQKLYQGPNTSVVFMPDYINELINYLRESLESSTRIVFEQRIELIDLDVAQAIPLGLILNECVVNAIKYAFVNRQDGIVRIDLMRVSPDRIMLSVSDNGIGLPEGFDVNENNSLGLDLIRGLAKQINGDFVIESHKGVHIKLTFT